MGAGNADAPGQATLERPTGTEPGSGTLLLAAAVGGDMSDDPEATLEAWKESMRAEHRDAIANPDPEADHRIEGVVQVNHRVFFEYDPETDSLERDSVEQVDELTDPELRSCACGVRGMDPDEAREHIRAARDGPTE